VVDAGKHLVAVSPAIAGVVLVPGDCEPAVRGHRHGGGVELAPRVLVGPQLAVLGLGVLFGPPPVDAVSTLGPGPLPSADEISVSVCGEVAGLAAVCRAANE